MNVLKTITKALIICILIVGVSFTSVSSYFARKEIATLIEGETKSSLNLIPILKSQIFILKEQGVIISGLESIVQKQEYIINQLREQAEATEVQPAPEPEVETKPTYKELKDHNVFIIGCSEGEIDDENARCWTGTGAVIKITDTETYIVTNNHVAGKGYEDVHIYVENDDKNVDAIIVAQHETEDVAVIKVVGTLKDKTAIPGISKVSIQDNVYTVGNPLGVRDVYSEGIVAGYTSTSLLVQMPCIFGSSGSGVYDSNGNLVGLVYALEVYPGFLGIPMARITHTLIVDTISIRPFLYNLGLCE